MRCSRPSEAVLKLKLGLWPTVLSGCFGEQQSVNRKAGEFGEHTASSLRVDGTCARVAATERRRQEVSVSKFSSGEVRPTRPCKPFGKVGHTFRTTRIHTEDLICPRTPCHLQAVLPC